MTRGSKFRSLSAVLLGALSIAAACGGGGSGTSENLASDQTLSFPLVDDVGILDPGKMSAGVDIDIFRNVFSGLYKFTDDLKQVPDIASGPPTISSDGLTYTFPMRHDVKFSNGDPVKADDFIYSWNRAARLQGDYASVFAPVVGYTDVSKGRATTMSGLKKIDDYNFSATLSAPAGYWYTEVALWTAYVVDQRVISVAGDDKWFTDPATYIGTGPFKMTARVAKQSIDFAPVANWYGGSTGVIKHVHIEVIADQKAELTKYESGNFSMIGYAQGSLTPEDLIRYSNDPSLKAQLTLKPLARTDWIGFNLKVGPFAGIDAGMHGRHAFSTAIDRAQLVDIACSKGTACSAATGGVITKGLQGFLGDNTDPNAVFNAAAAKAEYQAWDPTGSKVKGLVYTYNATAFNKAVCENLASQWQKNLGVTVQCASQDRASFFAARTKCTYPIFRHSWGADYDNPQDWFDFLFVTGGGSSGSCYSNPALDSLVTSANQKSLTDGLADYKKANQILVDQSIPGPLVYYIHANVVHPWVKGVDGNALYDFYWSDARILQHS
ncbi:MAG: peptide ABC transporter substrate-binding protein [Candidatus Dormibacteraeota bacterium]|nr:peptide ABC transporter substrate-binding protein [Candidatus Dormibacteraeota bacterium]